MRKLLLLGMSVIAVACGDDGGSSAADATTSADATNNPSVDAAANSIDAPPGLVDASTPSADAGTSAAVVVSYVHRGNVSTCLVRASDNTLWCTGNDTVEQVGSDTDWASIWFGQNACGLKQDKTLWCWGPNTSGQVGNGTEVAVAAPTQIGTDTWLDVQGVSSGMCAIRTDNTLWCWGSGLPSSPTQMNGATNWSVIGGVVNTVRAITSAGTLWEVIFTVGSPVVAQVGTDTDWETLGHGGRRQCGTKTDTSLWCVGDTTDRVPTREANTTMGWKSGVRSDLLATHAIKPDGTVWSIANAATTATEVFVGIGGPWASMSADGAGQTKCLVRTNGELWCWGFQANGSLGADAPAFTQEPVPFKMP